jgi:hypothetical protein
MMLHGPVKRARVIECLRDIATPCSARTRLPRRDGVGVSERATHLLAARKSQWQPQSHALACASGF